MTTAGCAIVPRRALDAMTFPYVETMGSNFNLFVFFAAGGECYGEIETQKTPHSCHTTEQENHLFGISALSVGHQTWVGLA